MSEQRELLLTRTFDAPRDLVWKAFTDVEHLAKWWGPPGSRLLSAELDLRPGGMFLYSTTYPGSTEPMWGKFVYEDVVAPELLRFRTSFSDPEGNTVRAPFSNSWPLEILNTSTFTEEGEKTIVTMRGTPYNATDEEWETFGAAREMVAKGMEGTLDQLDRYLAEVEAIG